MSEEAQDAASTPGINPNLLRLSNSPEEQDIELAYPPYPPLDPALADDTPPERVGLDCLADGPPDEKPPYSYQILVRFAILGSPKKRLTLAEIYTALEERYPWFKTAGAGWRNSIRHCLSLEGLFVRVARPITEPGKGSYWTLDLEAHGHKRARKRNKKPSKRAIKTAEDAAAVERRLESYDDAAYDQYDQLQFDDAPPGYHLRFRPILPNGDPPDPNGFNPKAFAQTRVPHSKKPQSRDRGALQYILADGSDSVAAVPSPVLQADSSLGTTQFGSDNNASRSSSASDTSDIYTNSSLNELVHMAYKSPSRFDQTVNDVKLLREENEQLRVAIKHLNRQTQSAQHKADSLAEELHALKEFVLSISERSPC